MGLAATYHINRNDFVELHTPYLPSLLRFLVPDRTMSLGEKLSSRTEEGHDVWSSLRAPVHEGGGGALRPKQQECKNAAIRSSRYRLAMQSGKLLLPSVLPMPC